MRKSSVPASVSDVVPIVSGARRGFGTRARILDAAASQYRDLGRDGVTLGGIARAAGLSVGSIYRYFGDRIAVLESLRERNVGLLRSTAVLMLRSWVNVSAADLLDVIARIVRMAMFNVSGFSIVRERSGATVRSERSNLESDLEFAEEMCRFLRKDEVATVRLVTRLDVALDVVISSVVRLSWTAVWYPADDVRALTRWLGDYVEGQTDAPSPGPLLESRSSGL